LNLLQLIAVIILQSPRTQERVCPEHYQKGDLRIVRFPFEHHDVEEVAFAGEKGSAVSKFMKLAMHVKR
jgi:hypothetical protein